MPETKNCQVITSEQLSEYISEVSTAAEYTYFGASSCNLTESNWWAVYTRQSMEEQSLNNRLPEYLLTCAREAKKLGVTVPRELVLYDVVTGEHLERPEMIRLRRLMAERKVAGIIFPALDRLSREPLHQQIFEMEACYYGIQLLYADVPSGNDPNSQFTRTILAHAAKLVKLANRKNAVGGNIGRAIKGSAPAFRASYGYIYRRDAELGANGRLVVKRAWWQIDALDADCMPFLYSPAWVVTQIYYWIGAEERTLYWVANQLNEMEIKAPEGGRWSPARVANILRNHCYTGSHEYNVFARVHNPNKPLGDITAEIKRTLKKPKPVEERVSFKVPALVSEELWQKANSIVTKRGRGRGKAGKSIEALLRGLIYCPRCGQPMIVRRDGRNKSVYYHCSKYFRPWEKNRCSYRRFLSADFWDELVWGLVYSLLEDDAWIEYKIASSQSSNEDIEKLIRLQQLKISQAQARIVKVREGFEAEIYSLEDAKQKIVQYQDVIAKANGEISRLSGRPEVGDFNVADIDSLKQRLKDIRDRNLNQATFKDRFDIIRKLGIKVYPTEDLRSVRVSIGLNIEFDNDGEQEQKIGCGKVVFAPPKILIKLTSIHLTFRLVQTLTRN